MTYEDGHQDLFDLQLDDNTRIPIEIDVEEPLASQELRCCADWPWVSFWHDEVCVHAFLHHAAEPRVGGHALQAE